MTAVRLRVASRTAIPGAHFNLLLVIPDARRVIRNRFGLLGSNAPEPIPGSIRGEAADRPGMTSWGGWLTPKPQPRNDGLLGWLAMKPQAAPE